MTKVGSPAGPGGEQFVYAAEAGLSSMSDAYFAGTPWAPIPFDGLIAVTYDTTAEKTRIFVRTGGVWRLAVGPL